MQSHFAGLKKTKQLQHSLKAKNHSDMIELKIFKYQKNQGGTSNN
jgi:hypothetical protein